MQYPVKETGLLLLDPYNDFLAPEGKLWPLAREVAEEVGLLANLRTVVDTARELGIQIFFVPHHRWVSGDFDRWQFPTKTQKASGKGRTFEKGAFGGTFHQDFQPRPADVIVQEHWGQSGFANTDLDQQLKQHGVRRIILIGMLANTCIESTGRFGMELGYHVTLVKDATAAFSKDAMHAAHAVNGPTFAHAITTTADLVASLRTSAMPAAS